MNQRKAKYAVLRHRSRKYPQIAIVFEDNSEKAITIRADIKTARTILFKIKQEIALKTFTIDEYKNTLKSTGITTMQFIAKYLDYRKRLVQIDQIAEATYQHDKFALNLLLERIDGSIDVPNLTNDDIVNFIVLLKDSVNKKESHLNKERLTLT